MPKSESAGWAAKIKKNMQNLFKKSPYALDEPAQPDDAAPAAENPFVLTDAEQQAIADAQQTDDAAPAVHPFTLTPDGQDAVDGAAETSTALAHPDAPAAEPAEPDASEPEPSAPDTPAATPRRRKRHWYGIPVGMIVVCLALVGAGWLCVQGYRAVYRYVTDDSAERAYDAFLTQVVMLDPEPFESINAADKNMILRAATWKTVDEVLAGTSYESDEQGRVVLAGEQLRTNAVQLFGVGCVLTDGDFTLSDDSDASVVWYDADHDQYHVPLLDVVGTYQPYTLRVQKKRGCTLLQVAYCVMVDVSTSSTDVQLVGADKNLAVVKTMEYELRHDDDTGMDYIAAIRVSDDGR